MNDIKAEGNRIIKKILLIIIFIISNFSIAYSQQNKNPLEEAVKNFKPDQTQWWEIDKKITDHIVKNFTPIQKGREEIYNELQNMVGQMADQHGKFWTPKKIHTNGRFLVDNYRIIAFRSGVYFLIRCYNSKYDDLQKEIKEIQNKSNLNVDFTLGDSSFGGRIVLTEVWQSYNGWYNHWDRKEYEVGDLNTNCIFLPNTLGKKIVVWRDGYQLMLMGQEGPKFQKAVSYIYNVTGEYDPVICIGPIKEKIVFENVETFLKNTIQNNKKLIGYAKYDLNYMAPGSCLRYKEKNKDLFDMFTDLPKLSFDTPLSIKAKKEVISKQYNNKEDYLFETIQNIENSIDKTKDFCNSEVKRIERFNKAYYYIFETHCSLTGANQEQNLRIIDFDSGIETNYIMESSTRIMINKSMDESPSIKDYSIANKKFISITIPDGKEVFDYITLNYEKNSKIISTQKHVVVDLFLTNLQNFITYIEDDSSFTSRKNLRDYLSKSKTYIVK